MESLAGNLSRVDSATWDRSMIFSLCGRVWGIVRWSCWRGELRGCQGWPWSVKHPVTGLGFPRRPAWVWHSLSQQRAQWNLLRQWGREPWRPAAVMGACLVCSLQGLKYPCENQFHKSHSVGGRVGPWCSVCAVRVGTGVGLCRHWGGQPAVPVVALLLQPLFSP